MNIFKTRKKCHVVALGFCMTAFVLIVFWPTADKYANENERPEVDQASNNVYCEKDLPDRCEIIHVAAVCAGYGAVRQFSTLVKSLVFFRKNPLHFHLIYDTSTTRHMLRTLFDTWNIPELTVSLYSVNSVVEDVRWIPNKHYSGVYGLLKLVLPKLLPVEIEKVLVLDVDLLCLADVAELWSLWRRFNATQALGLVENQSDWYLGKLWKGQQSWPAVGRGFNSGVILMDLAKLRSFTWMALWRSIAEVHLPQLGFTSLADQDIFNSVIRREPSIVFHLPCQWNVQLNENAREELCLTEISNLKIIHWNSPQKLKLSRQNRYTTFFYKQYQAFLEFDGGLLRHELFHCHQSLYNESTTKEKGHLIAEEMVPDEDGVILDDDECYDMRTAHALIHRVHVFYADYAYQPKDGDISLVTQLSLDRLQMLEQMLTHWSGPASVALYVSDAEAQRFMEFASESTVLSNRKDVAYHFVYKEGAYYPTNKLRNVALRESLTPMVFLIDVDFLPSYGAYESIRTLVASIGNVERKALVVPAFETLRYRLSFPKSKSELLNALDSGQLQIFRHDVWPQGHAATNYENWRKESQPYAISWKADFEPYVVVHRDVPPFDTRFLGFGWNKVAHSIELDAAGYDFIVLPNVFIIHLPHAPSYDIVKYRSSQLYRKCLRILKGEFLKDLTKRYNRQQRLQLNGATERRNATDWKNINETGTNI